MASNVVSMLTMLTLQNRRQQRIRRQVPLSGLITSACVLIGIYGLAGKLFWIRKATLSAVIIQAVWATVVPPRIFLQFWRTSFADFVASMISFWVTLFVSVEMGIASAVGYNVVYILFRTAFTGVAHVTDANITSI
jgi:solute carrier family 26 (sodium-independent sulfate anion transporter), member 11